MGVKLFSIVSLACVMTLCSKTSDATKCYECSVWAKKSDDTPPESCAGGELNKLNATDREAYTKDCGTRGCYKRRLEYAEGIAHDGIIMYKRSCADSTEKENEAKCKTVPDGLGTRVDCYCQEDYCNGAVTLHTQHAIIALVTSFLTVILASRVYK